MDLNLLKKQLGIYIYANHYIAAPLFRSLIDREGLGADGKEKLNLIRAVNYMPYLSPYFFSFGLINDVFTSCLPAEWKYARYKLTSFLGIPVGVKPSEVEHTVSSLVSKLQALSPEVEHFSVLPGGPEVDFRGGKISLSNQKEIALSVWTD